MADKQIIYTKPALIDELKKIAELGWIVNGRKGNVGGIGNTLEDLLGIKENNLPIPNAAEWELKSQRLNSSSLTTLFHIEPSPRAIRFVPQVLLPKYGWAHKEDGKKYAVGEMSFRQTIHGLSRSDRGFMVVIDRSEEDGGPHFDYQMYVRDHSDYRDTHYEEEKRRELTKAYFAQKKLRGESLDSPNPSTNLSQS